MSPCADGVFPRGARTAAATSPRAPLGLAASLGVFVVVFQGPLGYPDVTFFVPVTAGVLLVSLGADYSVFVMGRIWEESRRSRHGRGR